MNDINVDLVVGASGRVGRLVLPCWRKLNKTGSPVAQYRMSPIDEGFFWDPLHGIAPLLEAASAAGGFRTMFILAGSTPGAGWDRDLNRKIVEECLIAAHQSKVRRVLIASSSAVYGINNGEPFSENNVCKPTNEYGQAKLEMERACLPWQQQGLEICCLRIGNVAGADALLSKFNAADASPICDIDMFKDGRGPLRSYIGPETLAKIMRSLCEHPQTLPPVLNLAAPLPLYMEELAAAAGAAWRGRNASNAGHQKITLDCSRLRDIYKFDQTESEAGEIVRQWQACRI